MINGSSIRLPSGQFSTYVTPVNKDGVTQYITPVGADGIVIDGSVLPSGVLIGGVAYIVYAPTVEVPRPQTRPTSNGEVVGGLPLVIGDRWFKPDGSTWVWNGTYFVSAELYTENFYDFSFGSTKVSGFQPATNIISNPDIAGIFHTDFNIHAMFNSGISWDASNYTDFQLGYQNLNGGTIIANSFRIDDIPNTSIPKAVKLNVAINTAVIFQFNPSSVLGGYRILYLSQTKTGSAPDFISVIYISFRLIHI